MSFVLKFEEGGTPKKRTFKVGNDEYDLDQYVRDFREGYGRWAEGQYFNKKERLASDAAFRDYINELNSGLINLNVDTTATHLPGRITNREKGFDDYGHILRYANSVLKKQSLYKKEEPKSTKLKYNPKTGISDYLLREIFRGRGFDKTFYDKDPYDETNQTRGITGRIEVLNPYILKLIEDPTSVYDFENDEHKNMLLGDLAKLREAFSNNKIDDSEKLLLSNLGINADKWFYTGKGTVEELPEIKDDSNEYLDILSDIKDYNQNEITKQAALYRDWLNLPDLGYSQTFASFEHPWSNVNWDDKGKERINQTELRLAAALEKYISTKGVDIYNLSKEDLDKIDPDFFSAKQISTLLGGLPFSFIGRKNKPDEKMIDPNWTNGLKLAYLFDVYNRLHKSINQGNLPTYTDSNGNEVHIMNYDDKGYARVYNPSTRTMSYKKITDIAPLALLRFAKFFSSLLQQVPSNKLGGILKAQQGVNLSNIGTLKDIDEKYAQKEKEAKEEETKEKSEKSGRTVEQLAAADRIPTDTGFSTIDKVRLGSIGADIASMIAAFVPGYGTIASGILGIGSTGANALADFNDESVSTLSAFKNMGIGLGMDLYGLIPGVGASGKIAKITSNLVKYIPRLLPALALIDAFDIADSFKKIGTDEKLTVEDWRNISEGIGLITGTVRAGAVKSKKQAIKKGANLTTSGETYKVKTSDGTSFDLTKEQFDQLNQTRSLKEANDIFLGFKIQGSKDKSLIGSRNRIKPWSSDSRKFRGSGLTQTTGDTSYDLSNIAQFGFSKPKNGIFGRWSDVGLVNAELNPTTTWNWSLPNIYSVKTIPPPTPPKPKRTRKKTTTPKPKPLPKPQVSTGTGPGGAAWTKPGRATTNKNGGVLERMAKFKKGGSILKFAKGGVSDWYFDRTTNGATGIGDSFYNLGGWTGSQSQALAGNYILNNGHYKGADLTEAYNRNLAYITNKDLITSDLLNYYNTLGNLSAEEFVNLYNTNADKIRGFFNKGVSHSEQDSDLVGLHNDLFKSMFGNRSLESNDKNLLYNLGWQEGLKKRLGSTTWMRRMDTYENEFDLNNADLNRIHTITSNGKTFLVYKKANGNIGIWDPSKVTAPLTPEPPEVVSSETSDKDPNKDPSKTGSILTAADAKDPPSNTLLNTLMRSVGSFIGAGRLLGTLGTNSGIYDIMRRANRPLLQDTYETYSPVTGAFSEMQMNNSIGSSMLSAAHRPFTSDASLTAHRMRQGLLDANKYTVQGFLADDNAIQRTMREAMLHLWENLARRSNVANENRKANWEYRLRMGELKVDHKLSQWNAINNYLMGLESDAKDHWNRYSQYYQDAESRRLQMQANLELEPYRLKLLNWKSTDGDLMDQPWYKTYQQLSTDWSNKIATRLNDVYANLNGFPTVKFPTTF